VTQEADTLRTPEAVRERASELYALAEAGALEGWTLHPERLPAAADYVAETVRSNYPELDVPFHARWRHFVIGGADRWAVLARNAPFADAAARARAAFDLAIASVLLDAGAGAAWRYRDATGAMLSRSEGLAIASLEMFAAGRFSAQRDPLRADAARLAALDAAEIATAMQAGPGNPLLGLEGRAALLRRLGGAVAASPAIFARADTPRPGGLYDYLAAQAEGGALPARAILVALLHHLGPIWPGRESLHGIPLGDCWRHPSIRRPDATDGLIPFHKLSQWLAYSLIEPLQEAGIRVTGIDALTGLPEYRNGGLFLDLGVIAPRDLAAIARTHDAANPFIVEWRALTVALLDRIAPLIRERLGVAAEDFPLAKVLEGGTWSAGRRIARERRADGGPPLAIRSDGTVF